MDYLKDIIADIKRENCVLIIGPDMVDFGEKSFFETMCSYLMGSGSQPSIIDIAPQYVFPNEELLQLMPSVKETKLLRMMEEFYHKQTAFDIPLTKISQIPFHLIISLMPDDRLQNIFQKQNLEYNYAHYPRENSPKQIEKPTIQKPLIYNLLGDFNELDAIITFDHLFNFLSGIMGKRELPLVLQETLKRARTFIFLGVHFEKWYVQLLLRIITTDEKKDKYTILRKNSNKEVSTFVARRLELDFLETEPLSFLDELYNGCKKLDLLKRKTTVFISYKSENIEVVRKIEERLKLSNIEVIRDEIASHAGQKIEDFISTIEHVDSVLFVLSRESLKSTWVSKEISTCLNNRKKFVPCYIDKSFLDFSFWDDLKELAIQNSNAIGQKILERGMDSIEDLLEERKDWAEFKNNLPLLRNELNRGIAESLMPDDFEKNIKKLIQYIQIKH
jgi:TIR domain/SIR2-like domain